MAIVSAEIFINNLNPYDSHAVLAFQRLEVMKQININVSLSVKQVCGPKCGPAVKAWNPRTVAVLFSALKSL